MAASLLKHKRIKTTLAKAKALRSFVEPIINRAKEDTMHNRRMAFRYLREKEAVKLLFRDIAEKISNRNGGYTRILKLGNRVGDNAELCYIELVDFNELMLRSKTTKLKKTKSTRRGGKKKTKDTNLTQKETSGEEKEISADSSNDSNEEVKE